MIVALARPERATAFAALKRDVIARTGHFYYADKDSALWERLSRRMAVTGATDLDAYRALLAHPQAGEDEWAALEAEVTIGETFFFRYAEQFAALRETILPAIIEANRDRRRIRIWSAGCATGAEPYSVAILLRRLLGDELPQWRISILGTDINRSFLQAAERARYGAWALRAVPASERAEDFLPAPDGRHWTLRPQHRALVRFERQNLTGLLDGSAPLTLTDFDLILCRNVLIYFHPEMVQALVRALGERLSTDGWLLLGHAEPNPAFAGFLRQVDLPGTAAYRRPDGSPLPDGASLLEEPPAAPFWTPAPLPPVAAASAPVVPPDPPGATVAVATLPQDRADMLAAVRVAADGGETEKAWALCHQALEGDPMVAGLHLYAGLLAWTRGEPAEAERAFGRAIYLDTGHVMAHYQLGLLRLHRGDVAGGRRSIAHALRIARSLPPDTPLPEGDGLTAGEFRDLARLHMGAGAG